MGHAHKYESMVRLAVSKEAREAGIDDAELRKCAGCGAEAMFVKAKDKWMALLADEADDGQDILMA